MKAIRIIGCLVALLLAATGAQAQTANRFTLPDVEASPDTGVELPFRLDNTSDIVALQFTLRVPTGTRLDPASVALTERKQDHTVTARSTGTDTYMVMVYSPTNQPLRGREGDVLTARLYVEGDFTEGERYPFTLTDVVLSPADGSNVLTQASAGALVMMAGPDLAVTGVRPAATEADPDGTLGVAWQVSNAGQRATGGGWSEQISLVTDGGQRALLGTTYYEGTLAAGASASRSAELRVPRLPGLDGEARVEVRLVPTAEAGEASGDVVNNTALSDATLSVSRRLYLDLPAAALDETATTPVRCQLARSGDWTEAQTFTLTHTADSRVSLPATLTVPAGQSAAVFYLTLTDNDAVDADSTVSVTASGDGYPDATGTFVIADDELPALDVTASAGEVTEGERFTLTLRTARPAAADVTFLLDCDAAKRFDFPARVTLPAGENEVSVEVTAVDDARPDLTHSVTFTFTGGGYEPGDVVVALHDNDMPTLSLTLTPATVSEGAGPTSVIATLSRADHTESELTLRLYDNSEGGLYYTTRTLTLAPGQQSVQFNLGPVDNAEVDGERTVDVTAAVYVASCDCAAGETEAGHVTARLTVTDDDGPALTLATLNTMLNEGDDAATVLTLTRNTPTDQPLTVALTADTDAALVLPGAATIPAGAASVDLTVGAASDDVQQGDRTVVITATAEGFAPATCWVMVTDRTLPDATLADLTLTPAEGETGTEAQASVTVKNEGAATLPAQTAVHLYLGEGTDRLLTTLYTPKAVEPGSAVTVVKTFALPDALGRHTVRAVVNEDEDVKELTTLNNAAPRPATLTIRPAFTATLTTDKAVYAPGEAVRLTGQLSGHFAAGDEVEVYIVNEGARQTVTATADADGRFSLTWTPYARQMGHFAAGACYPGEALTTEQAAFDVYGLRRTTDDYLTCETLVGEAFTGTVDLTNPGSLALSGLKVEALTTPDDCQVELSIPATLAPGATATLSYTLTPTAPTAGNDWQEIPLRLTTAEGASLDLTLYHYARSPRARLTASLERIATTMTKGASREYSFTISNTGKGATGPITLSLPPSGWMQTATPATMASLESGETTTVTLRLTPTDDMALNVPVTGQIGINCANGAGLALPYEVEPVSESTGTLTVDVCDEYTYYTAEAPHVAGASVTVKHPTTGALVAQGTTGADGRFTATLPEGYYTVNVTADRHESYTNDLLVDPGRDRLVTVNLSYQAVKISWNVEETTVEDEYNIISTMQYETNVPRPVVEVIFPESLPAENQIFNIVATNKGLITAEEVRVAFPELDQIKFELLTPIENDQLKPQQSIVLTCRMTVTDLPVRAMRAKASPRGSIVGCVAGAIGMYYAWYCGLEDKKIGQAMGAYAWGECSTMFPDLGLPGPGGNGGGGDGGPSNPNDGDGGGRKDPYEGDEYDVHSTIDRSCNGCADKFKQALQDTFGNPVTGFLINNTGMFGAKSSRGLGSTLKGIYDEINGMFGLSDCAETYMSEKASQADKAACGLTSGLGHLADKINIPGAGKGVSLGKGIAKLADPCERVVSLAKKLNRSSQIPTGRMDYPPYILEFQENVAGALDAIEASEAVVAEIYGDPEWDLCDYEEQKRVADRLIALSGGTKLVDYEDVADCKPSNISDETLQRLVERWNNGIRYIKGEPVVGDNCIDWDLIEQYMLRVASANDEAQEMGYTSASDLLWRELRRVTELLYQPVSNSVCASITLQLSQTMTMTRQAFRGTLSVFNGNETIAMTDVRLNLEVRDEEGRLATSHEFQTNVESLDQFDGDLALDAPWTLAGGQTGTATILFIPTRYAAPTADREYSFGGTLSYVDPFTGLRVERELYPVTLTVKPSPVLDLTYFMQRDVMGDDALTTDVVEPSVPAEFALLVRNTGKGDATDVRIVTEQPEIVENEKGLLIDFNLLSAQLNGGEHTLALGGSVPVDFGTIPAGRSAYAQWWIESSLLGHFTDYDVEATHATSYGNEDLSLLGQVSIHELTRSLSLTDSEGQATVGFLTNDIADADDRPDALYLTDGSILDVAAPAGTSVEQQSPTQYALTVTTAGEGWTYGSVADPTGGRQELAAVRRQSDGADVPLRNFWQTDRTLRDGRDPLYENRLHFADRMGAAGETYVLTFEPRPEVELAVEAFTGVPESGTVASQPVGRLTVRFNKPVDAATFTADDVRLNCQGEPVDLAGLAIEAVSDREFVLDLTALTAADGYYVLTVQTAGITDAEGFAGRDGRTADWVQFASGQVDLTLQAQPEEGGTVSPASGPQPVGATVHLEARAAEGFTFSHWLEGSERLSAEPQLDYTVRAAATLTAVFTQRNVALTLTYTDEGGSVEGGGTGLYPYGTEVVLTATPRPGYLFEGWRADGALVETDATLRWTLTDAVTLEAVFVVQPAVVPETQTLALAPGWNWLSVRVDDPLLTDPARLLAPAAADGARFVGAEGELACAADGGWSGTLAAIDATRSYKLRAATDATLTLTGEPLDPDRHTITLDDGWNWVGYLPAEASSLDAALDNLPATAGDAVRAQDAFALYDGANWVGSLAELRPGEGYQFYSQGVKSFSYSASGARQVRRAAREVAQPAPWSYDARRYRDNMAVVARLYVDGSEAEAGRYVVGAFVGDECRGVSQERDGLHFLTIHGETDGEALTLRLWDGTTGQSLDVAERLSFADGLTGSLTEPLRLTAGTSVGLDDARGGLTLYPNPVRTRLYLRGDIGRVRRVDITDMSGSLRLRTDRVGQGIDVSAFSPGTYLIVVQTDDKVYRRKFLKY